MMHLELYSEEKHYETISEWWVNHGWDAIPKHKLPPFSYVICEDGKPIACSFAYMDNGGTGVAVLEWTVGDPNANPRSIVKGLKHLFKFMSQELEKLEYSVIMTSCRQKGLVKIFERCGFIKTDEGVTHLMKIKTD